MTAKRCLKLVLAREQPEGVGVTVRRSIGSSQLRNLDPFLMLDEGYISKGQGFAEHPHRGFETVTYMLKGTITHEDFAGHTGDIAEGGVQWMTAGRGIVHSEMPKTPEATVTQLWVNLPKSHKMMQPRYQEMSKEGVATAKSPDSTVSVQVLAGEAYGVKGNISTHIPIIYLDVSMQPNAQFTQAIAPGLTCFIYTLEGQAVHDDKKIEPHHTAVMDSVGDSLVISSSMQGCRFLVIAGKPINEPIVQHGPFVMNTEQEIRDTFQDYQMGRNGFENAPGWRSKSAAEISARFQ